MPFASPPYRRGPVHGPGAPSLGTPRQCLACNDTGILVNSDELINQFPATLDYDRTVGLDCALICTCEAAYPVREPGGKIIRHGFRLDSGTIYETDSWAGPRRPGVEPPAGLVPWLIERRAAAWAANADLAPQQRLEQVRQNLLLLREGIGSIGNLPLLPESSDDA